MAHMFEGCTSLTTLDLSSFDTSLTENIDNIFAKDYNLVYVDLRKYDESNMNRMENIFQGTLENMVFCFEKSTSKKLYKIFRKKGCSEIDCDSDWIKSRKIIIATLNQCVERCPDGYLFLYEYKCYSKCPDGTYPDNYVCKKSLNDTNDGENCDIHDYFLGKCRINLQTPKEKIKFIENTVNGIIYSDLYDLVLITVEGKQNLIIKEENEIYQLYAMNTKIRDPSLAYIDFGECEKKLKEYNLVNKPDDIIVFKIEYLYPDFKIPIIEYALFGIYGTKRLNLLTCNNMKINYYIPRHINDYEDYKYNPSNNYYSDKCFATFKNNTDLTVQDRRGIFNDKNMSLCESICTYKGYEYDNIICECSAKIKFNSFLNVNISKYDLLYRIEEAPPNIFNFWVIKCYLNLFTKDVIMKNICSAIILGIIFAVVVSTIIFCAVDNKIMNNKIKISMLVEINLNKKDDDDDLDNSKTISFKNENDKNDLSNSGADKKNNRYNNEIIQQNNNDIKKNDDKSDIINLKKMKECEEYTDNELNNLAYFDAIYQDKRSFFQIYFSLIKTKHLFVLAFGCKNDFNPRTMKIDFMLFIFAIFLTTNTIFITDSTLHKLFVSNGKVGLFSDLTKIGVSFAISSTIKNLLLLVAFPEMDIIKIREIENQNRAKRNQEIQEVKSMVLIRCQIFFFINIIVLSFIWIYIANYFMIFQNTQIYVIHNTLISFGISLFAPFILYFIPTFIRLIAVKGEGSQGRYCLYLLVTILQVIF